MENFIRVPVLLVPILSQMNPHHIVRCNVFLFPCMFVCLLRSFMLFAFSSSSLKACGSHTLSLYFGHPDNIRPKVQFVDLLTERFFHSSCFSYFVFFVLKHLTVVQDVCWRLMTSLIKASHIILPDL